MDDFLDNLLEDDIYNDNIPDDGSDIDNDDAFELELREIETKRDNLILRSTKTETKKIAKNGIVEDDKNLLVPATLSRVLEDLKCADMKYVTAPKIFINTLDGFISGIEFNEHTHMYCIDATSKIPLIKSNSDKKQDPNYLIQQKYKKSNRGRNKKKTSKDGNRSLKSQITMFVHRPEIERSTDIIKHKFFRGGRIQISGLTYADVESAKIMINDIIELVVGTDIVKKDSDGNPEHVELKSLSSTMENYKFNIIIEPQENVDLMRLKKEIIKNAYLMELINDTGDEIDIAYVKYDYTLAAMTLVLSIPNAKKKKKTLTTNVFSTGKINTLGCSETKYVRVVARFLNVVLEKAADGIIVYNRDCNWSNYLILPKKILADEHEPIIDPGNM